MGLPMKAPAPAPIPYASWQGFYIGGFVGAARLNASCTNVSTNGSNFGPCAAGSASGVSQVNSATGVAAGVEVGYDWQQRYFVYGVAADWTWTNLSHSTRVGNGPTISTFKSKVDWLASFRGRMGLAVDDTLVYVTGGLALGQLKSSTTECDSSNTCGTYASLSTVKVGWVAGVGAEHKFNQNWSVKGEFLYYDLGRTNTTGTGAPVCPSCSFSTDFNHEVLVGRLGVAYHF
jgi:outer membrane immunogenic protein